MTHSLLTNKRGKVMDKNWLNPTYFDPYQNYLSTFLGLTVPTTFADHWWQEVDPLQDTAMSLDELIGFPEKDHQAFQSH